MSLLQIANGTVYDPANQVNGAVKNIWIQDGKGFLVLFGNNHYVLRQIAAGETEKLRAYSAWLLASAKGYGMKLVNPGGVEVWKEGGGNVTGLDSTVEMFEVTPRQIITGLAQ